MSEQVSDEKTSGNMVKETKKTIKKRARKEAPDKSEADTYKHVGGRIESGRNSARGLSQLDSPTRRRVIERRRQRNDYSDMASVRVFSPSDVEEDKSSSSWVRRGDGEAFDILAERPMSEWRRTQMSTALRLAVSRLRDLSPKRTSPRKASSPKMWHWVFFLYPLPTNVPGMSVASFNSGLFGGGKLMSFQIIYFKVT